MYNEYPSHAVSAFRNDWWKACSFGKQGYDIANSCSCSSSYMPLQSNAEVLILKGSLPASSVFSNHFPVFILDFYYLKNGQLFINILLQIPTFCSILCHWSYQCFVYFILFLFVKFDSLAQKNCTFCVICVCNAFLQ